MCSTRVIVGPRATPGSRPWLCARSAYVFCCLEGSAWHRVHVLNSGQMVGVGAENPQLGAPRSDQGVNSASGVDGEEMWGVRPGRPLPSGSFVSGCRALKR